MNIVCIHGMNQQNQTAQSLKQQWLSVLKKGLSTVKQVEYFSYINRHFRMPFYGDLLSRQHLSNTLNASTLRPQKWPAFFQHSNVQNHTTPIQKHDLQVLTFIHTDRRQSLVQAFHQFRAITEDWALRDIALLLNYFPHLHHALLKQFLIESYLYLSDPHFITAVHQRIHQQLHPTNSNIIVAHSLGSVIAYHFLLLHPELKIQQFITLGSPLAFQVIQQHLPQPLKRPSALKGDWLNFHSHEDFLSAIPLRNTSFDFQPAIINQDIRTSIEHPHDITGYLQHPVVISSLLNNLKKPA